jgi:hypothetical protein
VSRWEQYEVWVRNGDKWEFIAAFADLGVAQSVAHGRRSGVRLVHAVIEEGRPVHATRSPRSAPSASIPTNIPETIGSLVVASQSSSGQGFCDNPSCTLTVELCTRLCIAIKGG